MGARVELPQPILQFELLLTREASAYRAQVLASPTQAAPSSSFSLTSIDDSEVEALRSVFINGQATIADWDRVRQLGCQLFGMAFAEKVGECFQRSLVYTHAKGCALQIRLRIQDDSLAMLPWEMMFCEELSSYLATFHKVTLARFTPTGFPNGQRKTVRHPIGVLVHISDDDAASPKLDGRRELRRIKEALEPLIKRGDVELRKTKRGTWDALCRALEEQSPHIEVLHIIGHGRMDGAEGAIVMGPGQTISATTLATRLGGSGVSVCVLNTCESATGRDSYALAGVAQKLVTTAIPAAIAMQFKVTDEAAIAFSAGFYDYIAKGRTLDTAVTKGRVNMVALNSFEWMTPVLYVANPDAMAFALPPRKVGRDQKHVRISRVAECNSHTRRPAS